MPCTMLDLFMITGYMVVKSSRQLIFSSSHVLLLRYLLSFHKYYRYFHTFDEDSGKYPNLRLRRKPGYFSLKLFKVKSAIVVSAKIGIVIYSL